MSTVDWAMIGGISAAGLVFAVAAIVAVVKWDQFLEADSQDGRDQVAREQGAPVELDVDWRADTAVLALPQMILPAGGRSAAAVLLAGWHDLAVAVERMRYFRQGDMVGRHRADGAA